ncbi:MAG TPA: hypothetical protein VGX68_18685 [Thermoanaerobaculia bacterium]|jgi:hypothetical protein|nr:hypothetical protein [Thermoanaerobaculia bacterium]
MSTHPPRRTFAFVQLLTLLSISSSACLADDCLEHAWKGTIGKTPVMIELNSIVGEDKEGGRYYYRTSLVDLLLERDEAAEDRWKEIDPKGKVTGLLTFTCNENSLSGQWQSPDGKTKLPIHAEAAASYSEPRLQAVKLQAVRRDSIGSSHYEIVGVAEVGSVEGLRLLGDAAGLQRINQTLLDQFREDLDNAITCTAYGRLTRGPDHGFEHQVSFGVVAWSKDYVVISADESGFCGGAYPYHGQVMTTYNLQSGQLEDVSSWLAEAYRKDISLDSDLGKILAKFYREQRLPEDADCFDSLEFSSPWEIWPTETGLTFFPSFSHAQAACEENISVPFQTIEPFLSPEGRIHLRSFQGH